MINIYQENKQMLVEEGCVSTICVERIYNCQGGGILIVLSFITFSLSLSVLIKFKNYTPFALLFCKLSLVVLITKVPSVLQCLQNLRCLQSVSNSKTENLASYLSLSFEYNLR